MGWNPNLQDMPKKINFRYGRIERIDPIDGRGKRHLPQVHRNGTGGSGAIEGQHSRRGPAIKRRRAIIGGFTAWEQKVETGVSQRDKRVREALKTMDDIKRTAKDIADQATDMAHDVADNAQDVSDSYMDQARDKLSGAADAAQNIYGRARDQVQDTASRLPGSASDAIDTGRRVYTKSQRQLSRQVARQPIEALLLAGAIGYLVGWATNRN